MVAIEIPHDVVHDYDQEEKYVLQQLLNNCKESGHSAFSVYCIQCGYWRRCDHYRPTNRVWRMRLNGYPVYSVDVEFCKNEEDERTGIEVYHWKGDHRSFFMGCRQEGTFEHDFDGVRRSFTGSIATRGV